jgi:Gluconate 2-dehydrogenase subunit 3
MKHPNETGRREFLVLMSSAIAATPSVALAQSKTAARKGTAAPAAALPPGRDLKFFTAAEFRTLDELGEMIIPADDRSGGARAAGVAPFIDARIAESVDPAWRQSWRDDLAEINRLSQALFGKSFAEGSFEQKAQLLERISRNEKKPKEPGEFAFGTIKWAVAETYYRTKIGIHDEIGYAGNVLLDQFIGTDISGQPAMKKP